MHRSSLTLLRRLRLPLALLAVTAARAHAADLVVTPGGSIQVAIDTAVDGDRVLVQPGWYTELVDFGGKRIELIGVGGASTTTLDGGGAGPVVRFASGEGEATRLVGFTVTGGFAAVGPGGIAAVSGATPTIEDCVVRGNHGRFGGGVGGTPVMRRCSIHDNVAHTSHGGGVYGAPRMTHCVVAQNTATSGYGGGLYLVGGSARLEDCVLVDNASVFSGGRGGGLYVDSTAQAEVEGCVIAHNFGAAGAVAAYGGGAFVESAGTTFTACTIYGNQLAAANVLAGGVYGPATLQRCIVRGNDAGQLEAVATVTFSDVEGGHAGAGNFDAPARFVDPLGRDFHLDYGSPCIGAGDPFTPGADGSLADLGAFGFRTLYTRANTRPADWDAPSWPEVSSLVGGTQVLGILAGPASAGAPFQTAGSRSGTFPGVRRLGVTLPLNPDAYFVRTLAHPDAPPLVSSTGFLDGRGRGTSTFTLPPSSTRLPSRVVLHHATLAQANAPHALPFVSDPLAVRIVR